MARSTHPRREVSAPPGAHREHVCPARAGSPASPDGRPVGGKPDGMGLQTSAGGSRTRHIQGSTPVSTQERLQGEQFQATRRAHALEPCEVEGLCPWEARLPRDLDRGRPRASRTSILQTPPDWKGASTTVSSSSSSAGRSAPGSGRCHRSLWRNHPESLGRYHAMVAWSRPVLSMPSSGHAASSVPTSAPSAELWRRRLSRQRWLQGAQHRQIQLPLPSGRSTWSRTSV